MKSWDYMGNRVVDLFSYGDGIGEVVYEANNYQVRRLTIVDWNQALTIRKEDVHLDPEEMFLLDWSAPGEWFIVITW